jgi:hypothetical protein
MLSIAFNVDYVPNILPRLLTGILNSAGVKLQIGNKYQKAIFGKTISKLT